MWKQFVGEEMERKQDDLSLSLFTFLSRKLEEELPPTLLFPGANVDIKKKKENCWSKLFIITLIYSVGFQ